MFYGTTKPTFNKLHLLHKKFISLSSYLSLHSHFTSLGFTPNPTPLLSILYGRICKFLLRIAWTLGQFQVISMISPHPLRNLEVYHHNLNRILSFNKTISNCNLIDLGFNGPKFTWTNSRNKSKLILERLDRFMANPDWLKFYPKAVVYHLSRTYSDHCPLILDTNTSSSLKINKKTIVELNKCG